MKTHVCRRHEANTLLAIMGTHEENSAPAEEPERKSKHKSKDKDRDKKEKRDRKDRSSKSSRHDKEESRDVGAATDRSVDIADNGADMKAAVPSNGRLPSPPSTSPTPADACAGPCSASAASR